MQRNAAVFFLLVAVGLGGASSAHASEGYGGWSYPPSTSYYNNYNNYYHHDPDYSYDYYDAPARCPRGYTEQYDPSGRIAGCAPIVAPEYRPVARQNHLNCGPGYQIAYDGLYNRIGCTPLRPREPRRPEFPNHWNCPPGYEIAYDSLYNRVGCTPRVSYRW